MALHPENVVELAISGAGSTDRGRRRELNEDRILVRDDLRVYAVCDGAGGHNAGEVAAALAVRSIASQVASTAQNARRQPEFDRFGLPAGARRISAAVHRANQDIIAISRVSDQHRGMGTTCVSTLFSPRSGLVHVANVGDSRCYRLRARHLELLTQDHSLLTDVVENRPDLDDAALERLPRNLITRALGVEEELRVSVRSHAVLGGDRYLLCSDGLHTVVDAEHMAEILTSTAPRDEVSKSLVEAANHRGGPDNIAVVVVDCHAGPTRALPLGSTAPPPADFAEQAFDPEFLVLGHPGLSLDSSASARLLESLRQLVSKK